MPPRKHCQYHCGACHEHFVSLAAFDLHRSGSFQRTRRCRSPESVKTRAGDPKLVVAEERGVCDAYELLDPVRVWGTP